MKNKSISLKFILLFFLITLLMKPVWLFDASSLSDDDLSYWLHASTLAFDFDINYQNDYFINDILFEEEFKTPSHPPGAGYLSSPFVFLFSIFDKIFNNKINRISPIGLYSYLGYFFSTQLFIFLGFYFLNKLFIQYKINKFKPVIFLLAYLSTLVHYSSTRFLMAHASEFFLVSYLVFIFEKKNIVTSKDIKKALFVLFLLAITRPSTFIISINLLIMHRKKISIQIRKISNLSFFILLTFGYNQLSKKLYNTGTILLDLSSNKTTESFAGLINLENLISGFLKIHNLFFSFSGGLLWTTPIIFFGVISYFFNRFKNKNFEYTLFSFLFIFGFFVVSIIWKGGEVAYGQRLFIGLLPYCAFQVGLFCKYNFTHKILTLFTVICYLHYLFLYSSDLLTLKEGYSLWGNLIIFSQDDYTINLFSQLLNYENHLNILSKSIYSILFFGLIQFESFFVYLPEFLQNLNQVSVLQLRANRYFNLDFSYIFVASLIYFYSVFNFLKLILPKSPTKIESSKKL